jgi:hypothetical protein
MLQMPTVADTTCSVLYCQIAQLPREDSDGCVALLHGFLPILRAQKFGRSAQNCSSGDADILRVHAGEIRSEGEELPELTTSDKIKQAFCAMVWDRLFTRYYTCQTTPAVNKNVLGQCHHHAPCAHAYV